MSFLTESKLKKGVSEGKRWDFFGFIHSLKEELKKVSWTTKEELFSSTKIVIWSTLFFGVGIYAVDLVIKGVLELFKRGLLFIFR